MKSIFLLLTLIASIVLVDAHDTLADAGLQAGDPIGAFYVTKAAGAPEDGVEVGDQLCYRCKYGPRPMAMVFTRSMDKSVANLVSQIDQAALHHADDQLRTLVVLLGPDPDKLQTSAAKMAEDASAKQTPIVIAVDSETGPLSYRIYADDEVTVVLARDNQVETVMAGDAGTIDGSAVTKAIDGLLKP